MSNGCVAGNLIEKYLSASDENCLKRFKPWAAQSLLCKPPKVQPKPFWHKGESSEWFFRPTPLLSASNLAHLRYTIHQIREQLHLFQQRIPSECNRRDATDNCLSVVNIIFGTCEHCRYSRHLLKRSNSLPNGFLHLKFDWMVEIRLTRQLNNELDHRFQFAEGIISVHFIKVTSDCCGWVVRQGLNMSLTTPSLDLRAEVPSSRRELTVSRVPPMHSSSEWRCCI